VYALSSNPSTAKRKKKSNAGSVIVPDFKLCYRAILTKTAWYQYKNRHINPWNRIENLIYAASTYGVGKTGYM
jgi:hypothetical protein